jgi:hypothetical protein
MQILDLHIGIPLFEHSGPFSVQRFDPSLKHRLWKSAQGRSARVLFNIRDFVMPSKGFYVALYNLRGLWESRVSGPHQHWAFHNGSQAQAAS